MENIFKDIDWQLQGKTFIGCGIGALVGGPVGMIIGGVIGFTIGMATQEEKEPDVKEGEPSGKATDGNGIEADEDE